METFSQVGSPLTDASFVSTLVRPADTREAPRAPPPLPKAPRSTDPAFALDPQATLTRLNGALVPGFTGMIRALSSARSTEIHVILGAPGVYPDGFKVAPAWRTAALSATEERQAVEWVRSQLRATERKSALSEGDEASTDSGADTHANVPSGSRPYNHRPQRAAEIMTTSEQTADEPENWVVPGYIPAGLTIMAGAPKLGKSWLVLDMAINIARGSALLGSEEPCPQGEVLYLACEDTNKRIGKRLLQITEGDKTGMENLEIWTLDVDIPTLDHGLVAKIEEWCDGETNPRMIIVDTLQRVRGQAAKGQSAYEADYACISALQKIAAERDFAVIVVTHTRKSPGNDPFECVSGTLGISGAADATMVIRKRDGKVTLYARGRDIEEMEEGLLFDPEACRWTSTGRIAQDDEAPVKPERSAARQAVIDALTGTDDNGNAITLTPAEIAERTGAPALNTRQLLMKMAKSGEVRKVGRCYALPISGDNAAGDR